MRLLTIKEICEKKEVSIKELAKQVGMSEQNFHRCIRNNKIDAGLLENVAIVLEVPITVFYDEKVEYTITKTNKFDSDNRSNELLESKDREIELLKQTIQDKNDIIALLKSRDARTGDNVICAVAGGQKG